MCHFARVSTLRESVPVIRWVREVKLHALHVDRALVEIAPVESL